MEAGKELMDAMSHRLHLDTSVNMMVELLFGVETGSFVRDYVVPRGEALVDDWDCLKSVVSFDFLSFLSLFAQKVWMWIILYSSSKNLHHF